MRKLSTPMTEADIQWLVKDTKRQLDQRIESSLSVYPLFQALTETLARVKAERAKALDDVLKASIAMIEAGELLRRPLPSMTPWEVKQERDARLSGAHKVFDVIHALRKACDEE